MNETAQDVDREERVETAAGKPRLAVRRRWVVLVGVVGLALGLAGGWFAHGAVSAGDDLAASGLRNMGIVGVGGGFEALGFEYLATLDEGASAQLIYVFENTSS